MFLESKAVGLQLASQSCSCCCIARASRWLAHAFNAKLNELLLYTGKRSFRPSPTFHCIIGSRVVTRLAMTLSPRPQRTEAIALDDHPSAACRKSGRTAAPSPVQQTSSWPRTTEKGVGALSCCCQSCRSASLCLGLLLGFRHCSKHLQPLLTSIQSQFTVSAPVQRRWREQTSRAGTAASST